MSNNLAANKDLPLVSVCMVTYNHEKYIAKAIESILMQKTTFSYEVIIGEDCSTDNTRKVIQAYEAIYPDIIKPIYHAINVGAQKNSIACLTACKGRYIAALEGDDYWIDPLKLQTQIDFLEVNPDFSMCCSKVIVLNEVGTSFQDPFPSSQCDIFTIKEIILSQQNLVPTPTAVYRNVLPRPLPAYILDTMCGDIALQLTVAHFGKVKHFKTCMAAYRQHGGGISKSHTFIHSYDKSNFNLLLCFDKYTDGIYHGLIRQRLYLITRGALMYARYFKGIHKIKYIYLNIFQYLKYSEKIKWKELAYFVIVWFFPSLLKKYGQWKGQ